MSVKTIRPVYKAAFNMRIDPDVYEALSKENHVSGKSMTTIVHEALRKHLKMEKKNGNG